MTVKRRISSDFTFIAKFIIPSIFYLSMLGAFIGLTMEGQYGGTMAVAFVMLTFGTLIYFGFVCLKCVEIDDNFIYISNYVKTIKLSFSEIENVSDLTLGGNYQPIFISFKKRTEFGNKITFLNSTTNWFNFSEQPIVKELNERSREKTMGNINCVKRQAN